MEIKTSFDKTGYISKEEAERNMGHINNRLVLAENHIYINNSAELISFADMVGNRGHAFSAVNVAGKSREDENFEQMQLFALDFDSDSPDSKTTWEQEFARAEQYNLPILFAYETLRSENRSRFRIVFLNDGIINDKKAAEFILKALITIFPNCDRACGNVMRIYLGGKNLFYFNENIPTIDVETLDIALGLYMKDKYGPDHYKRELQKFAQKCGLCINKSGMPDIMAYDYFDNGEILPSPLLYKNEDDKKSPKYYVINFSDSNNTGANNEETEQKKSYSYHKVLREQDTPKLRLKCRLFREFESGERWLWHNELFGLATNLVHVDKGKILFLFILAKIYKNYPKYWSYQSKYDYFKNYCLSYIEKHYNCPQGCEKFCPYKDDCDRAIDIISTVKVKLHEIVKVVNQREEYVPLEEAEEDFKNQFNTAMSARENKVYVIKAQTALGKTEVYLDYMKVSNKPCLIAVPTNILKNDVYMRAVKKLGVDEIKKHPEFMKLTGGVYMEKVMELGSTKVMKTPSLTEIMEERENQKNPTLKKIWSAIKKLYDSGQYKKVVPTVKATLKKEDIPILSDFLAELEKLNRFDGHIITTHGRFLNMPKSELQRYEIILDEDIVKTVLSNKVSIGVDCLKNRLKSRKYDSPAVDKLIDVYEIIRQPTLKDIIFTLPKCEITEKDADMSWGFDISAFCEAGVFWYHLKDSSIIFIKPAIFHDLKYTVVSATADKMIYEYRFGKDKVNFHECKQTAYIGELVQYYNNSMSRSFVKENLKIYFQIEKALGKMPRITFKEFAGDDPIYFGKTEGCDFYKGKNIAVIGTPHFPPCLYKLIAYTIGLEFDGGDELRPQEVTCNGYRFSFMTYKDEGLRNVQRYLIEGELEQAVGRARLLRCDCTVYLFSNFPLRQARLERFEFT